MNLNEEFEDLVRSYVDFVNWKFDYLDIAEKKDQYTKKLFGNLYEDYIKNVKLGVGIGPGWLGIYHSACLKLSKYVEKVDCDFSVTQVKQKFGELRIYYTTERNLPNDVYNEIDDILHEAAVLADNTCETCGKQGTLIADGYIRVACEEHRH